MTPEYAKDSEFIAHCVAWQQNGYPHPGFADWFAERGLEAQAAGWKFLAGGYDGEKPTTANFMSCNLMVDLDHKGLTPEGVARFLEGWAKNGLSHQQLDAARYLLQSEKPVRTCGGYAGTGKTRLLSHLAAARPSWRVCAFTGKAASILRRKGVQAWTIHASIYRSVWEGNRFVRWEKKSKRDLGCEGFLIDEASMVSKDIYEDLLSYGLPIIAVGDHGQLPAVGEDAGLMLEPDVRLEELHRNAGPIAKFAEMLRKGAVARDWRLENGATPVDVREKVPQQALNDADQIICAFNRTRVALNKAIVGRKEPREGDRIICLDNDAEVGVFNGQQGRLQWIDTREKTLGFLPTEFTPAADDGSVPGEIIVRYDPDAWNNPKREKKKQQRRMRVGFDFGYAITCHKAQGDQWGKVVVIEQRYDDLWDHARWAYTAASRAVDSLIWQVAGD